MVNTIRIPVPDVAYARVDLPAIDINDNPFQAVESAIGTIGNALETRDARNDEAFLAEAKADLYNTAANHAAQAHRNLSEPGPAINANDLLEERYKYWESKARNSRVRNALRQVFATTRLHSIGFEIDREVQARAANSLRIAGTTMDELAGIAYRRPEAIGAVRDEARRLREYLPGEQETFARHEQWINEAYLRGLIETNPKLALETLRSRKGHAEEDPAIPEPLREALEYEAEHAANVESDSQSIAQQHEQIGFRLDTEAKLAGMTFDTGFPLAAYNDLREAYKANPATGRQLEAKIDEAHANAHVRNKRHHSVGRTLIEGNAIAWDAHHLESLDAHIDAAANDGKDEATANHRRVRLAVIANQVPPKMQGRIREGLRSSDPARRAASAHMLQALETADEKGHLTSWVPPDLRAFGHRFTALTAVGFAEVDALKHLDAAKSLAPATEIARRHHFDTYVRVEDLAHAVATAFNVAPAGIA